MKLGILFSGGKDSTYAAWLAKKEGYEITCLISIFSENPESFMFHTTNIKLVEKQSEVMNVPIIIQKTKGEKESELRDLETAIKIAVKKYKIQGIVTGAIQSIYQSSRIQKICQKLNLECFNPLWQKNELGHLKDLIKNKFEITITGVSAYPLDNKWLGRKIDKKFIEEIKFLNKKYKLSMIGEGGEFETFVLNCPLFKKKLELRNVEISGKDNSWRMEVEVK